MKKIAITILICLISLGSIWFLYKRYIDYHMIQTVEKQPDIVFSQDKRMKCYTPPLAKISFFKKLIPALKIPQGSY